LCLNQNYTVNIILLANSLNDLTMIELGGLNVVLSASSNLQIPFD